MVGAVAGMVGVGRAQPRHCNLTTTHRAESVRIAATNP
jgi:hypothetical protein